MSLGLHVGKNSKFTDNKHKSMLDAVKAEVTLFNLSAIALFQMGPLNRLKNSMDTVGIKKYCLEHNIAVYPHSSYLAGGIWNVTEQNRMENKNRMYIRLIRDQLVLGAQIGAKSVVFHLTRQTISTVVETMIILSDCKEINALRKTGKPFPMFMFEAIASRGDPLLTYETAKKLNALTAALAAEPRITLPWNLCLDTCHMFAGGTTFAEANSWNMYEAALTKLTREKIQLFHLNGALGKNFGVGKDGHRIPMSREDSIWGHLISDTFWEYIDAATISELNAGDLALKLFHEEMSYITSSSLFSIVQFAKKQNIGMIMEINLDHYKSAKLACDIINYLLKL
jgi:endonuclease IV